jgi:hypothetical protein
MALELEGVVDGGVDALVDIEPIHVAAISRRCRTTAGEGDGRRSNAGGCLALCSSTERRAGGRRQPRGFSGIALSYNVCITILSGFAPLAASAMMEWTGMLAAPAA